MRDIRRLQEDLKVLAYPNEISILGFSNPNFGLMADILSFLVRTFEPGFIVNSISTESDRVKYIKEIAILISTKTPVSLNTRSLYKSEYGCVKELTKLSKFLVKCLSAPKPEFQSRLDLANRGGDLKRCRHLAREITETGAELFHLLENEIAVRERRIAVLAQPVELPETAQLLQAYIKNLQLKSKSNDEAYESILADQQNLITKIEKKKSELERSEKRLKALSSVRPAYMDEYERIEQELVVNYQAYMVKFRNLAYLEQLLDTQNAEERERAEEVDLKLKGLQKKMKEEELEMMRREKEAGFIGGTLKGVYKEDVGSVSGEEISIGASNGESHRNDKQERPREAKQSHGHQDSPSSESSLGESASSDEDFSDNDF